MKHLLTTILLLTSLFAGAQTTISGTVVDKTDKEPLIGVGVQALLAADTNTRSSTVTDIDGHFSLANLPALISSASATWATTGFRAPSQPAERREFWYH